MSISNTQRTLQRHRVRLLRREALRANLLTFKQKDRWLTDKVLACNGDDEALEDLRELMRTMPFPFGPQSIDAIRRNSERQKQLAKAFDQVETVAATIAKVKTKWPIRVYCEQYRGLAFNQRGKCKCPLHDGDSLESFVIDEQTGRWFCFGNCPHDPGKNYRSGDVIDLHRIGDGLSDNQEAVAALLALPPTATIPSDDKPKRFLVGAVKVRSERDERLIARPLRICALVTRDSIVKASPIRLPRAEHFARWLMQERKPLVVAYTKYEALVGRRALLALAGRPARLQYLCCSTAKTEKQRRRTENLNVERPLFLDVEFDKEAPDNQLKILWWLKTVRKWHLIAITFSGGKSWHGLFDVRGLSESLLARRRTLAKRLGACPKSLEASQWVRFPGGTRTKEDWRQTPVAPQEIVYLDV